jgi:hypothetical protein
MAAVFASGSHPACKRRPLEHAFQNIWRARRARMDSCTNRNHVRNAVVFSRCFSQTENHFSRAKLSSIRFKMLCTQVIACMIDGSSIDHEKISKMTKDASFDNSDTKAVLAAINHMFRSAARFDCDEEVFSNEIGQLGLPKEHVDAMVRCFKDKKATLRGALREDMISAPLLRSIDWRASVILASSDSAVDKIPVSSRMTSFHLTIILCLPIPLLLSPFLLRRFNHSHLLQDGIAHLHMILNDGGQERIVSFAAGAATVSAFSRLSLKPLLPHFQVAISSTPS